MMKAVVLHEADEMRVEQRPVPDPGSGEVLLKVNVTSICGTDVKVLHRKLLGQPDGPFIMGHEYAGTVAALGPGVDEFKVGDEGLQVIEWQWPGGASRSSPASSKPPSSATPAAGPTIVDAISGHLSSHH